MGTSIPLFPNVSKGYHFAPIIKPIPGVGNGDIDSFPSRLLWDDSESLLFKEKCLGICLQTLQAPLGGGGGLKLIMTHVFARSCTSHSHSLQVRWTYGSTEKWALVAGSCGHGSATCQTRWSARSEGVRVGYGSGFGLMLGLGWIVVRLDLGGWGG